MYNYISKYIYCSLDTLNVQVIVLTKVLNVSVHNHLAGAQLAAAAPLSRVVSLNSQVETRPGPDTTALAPGSLVLANKGRFSLDQSHSMTILTQVYQIMRMMHLDIG